MESTLFKSFATAAMSEHFRFVCDFEERKTRIITSGTAHHIQPTWVNDGRHLYITQRTSTQATRVMILTEFEEAKSSALHNEKFGNCSRLVFIIKLINNVLAPLIWGKYILNFYV